ncbi:MAG: FAD:protein FMN transferase [Bacillota bacterium]
MKAIKAFAITLIVILVFLATGCTANSGEKIVFGTFYNIQLKGRSSRSVLKDVESLLIEIENQTSTVIEGSDIYKINRATANHPIEIGHHTYELFKASTELYDITDGAFNPAVYPLVELWNFSPDKFSFDIDTLPEHADIMSVLEYSNLEFFELDENNMTLTKSHNKAKLDFGGIAKGYVVDLIKERVEDMKEGLISIGGDILPLSKTANIGITHPRQSGLFGVVKLNNLAISTSGDYERYYMIENTRYSHIMDYSGHPASINNHDIISASVIGESAMFCDALATSVIVNGLEWAAENIENLGYKALLIRQNTNNHEQRYFNKIGNIDFESRQSDYEQHIYP